MSRFPSSYLLFALLFGSGALWLSACDTDITGTEFGNREPDTELSVRDESLADNLADADRLSSTVSAAWTGTDPDGYVVRFEFRYFDEGDMGGEWVSTARNDTLVLLPIPRGDREANVVFEVRAIDNEDGVDPTPARTVFPIKNAPPRIRFSSFDAPPDTTFHVVSFAWVAQDPEGIENIDRIEVALNDTLSFTSLPAETEFVTFVGEVDPADPFQTETEVRVYTGRGFQSTATYVPGLRLDDLNTLYIRAVDQTDTTSARVDHSWYVKKQNSEVLFVNDYRKASHPTVSAYHLDLLLEAMPVNTPIDTWDVTIPFASGSSGNTPRSTLLPPSAEPMLREQMASWSYIYWVSTNTVNQITGNNLPYTAGVLDAFFDRGGKMMVHTPITQPSDPEANLGNPATLLLPLSELFIRPDSLQRMELGRGAAVSPVNMLPGLAEPLPELESANFFFNELPFFATGSNTIPLYEASYGYLTRRGGRGTWTAPRTIVSISADARVALFALPMVNEANGSSLLTGADGDPRAPQRAVQLILESLGFPSR